MLLRPSLRKHRIHEIKELQITSFMNLMVILIPFLLVTAVFTRMAAIELTLPVESKVSQHGNKDIVIQKFKLIVSISEDEIGVLNDGTPLRVFKREEKGSYNLPGFSMFLLKLKQQYPEEKSAVVLSRSSISYKTLVEIIDAVREGFPDISLGEL